MCVCACVLDCVRATKCIHMYSECYVTSNCNRYNVEIEIRVCNSRGSVCVCARARVCMRERERESSMY